MTADSSETLLVQGAAAFRRAAAACGVWEKRYVIDGQRLHVRYTGRDILAAIHAALAHRETPSTGARPDLSIDVFTSVEPPVRLPSGEWTRASITWRNDTAGRPDLFMHYTGSRCQRLTLLSRSAARGFVCYAGAERIPAWDLATPLRELLNAWWQPLGGQVVHGAAVGDERDAVLLAGAGGSGKSSTALTCLGHSALRYLGDDLCLLSRAADRYTVQSLYSSAKLCAHDLSRYAHLSLPRGTQSVEGDEKPALYLWPAHAERLADERPLAAILLPRVTAAAQPRIVPATSADAWRALAPSTLQVVPGDAPAALAWIAAFVRSLPVYRLELSPDRTAIAGVIHEFLCSNMRRAA